MSTKNEKISRTSSLLSDHDLLDLMKHSFEFWHNKYNNSLVNYHLVWKKAMESDSEIIKKIEKWNSNSNQDMVILLEQFFEIWSDAIKKSNFELAKKSIEEWNGFWSHTTDDQFKMCSEILKMIENYWKEIQIKNIE